MTDSPFSLNHRQKPERGRSFAAASLLGLASLVLALGATVSSAEPASTEEAIAETILTGLRQTGDEKSFSAVLDLIGTPRSKLILLRNPDRVAIDLFDTVSALSAAEIAPNGLVSSLRQGLVAPERYRMVFTLKNPGLPKALLETNDGRTRLTLTIEAAEAARFAAAARDQSLGGEDFSLKASVRSPDPAKESQKTSRRFVVVVDPGHGGVDTGAVGRHGTEEKSVNLSFAKALRDSLAKDSRIDVRLTRDDDRFISLSARSEVARAAKADLFISLHADSIRYAEIRGATVYTLSERASDQLAREIAESENSADRFVDPQWQRSEPDVFDILVELMRRETDSFSEHFAAGLVQEFGRHDIRLIRNAKRSAGFKVLTAPDVPSVLVEIGYLSNVDDEQLLLDGSWRSDTANAIAAAVLGFLDASADGRSADGR